MFNYSAFHRVARRQQTGEGRLKVNGKEVAHVDDAKDRRQAFRAIEMIAER